MSHTPGPWVVAEVTLANPGRLRVVRTVPGGVSVAEAQRPNPPFNTFTEQERDANAHLMSAAPELLAALTELVEAVERRDGQSGPVWAQMQNAQDAIAKATGQLKAKAL